MPMRSVFLLLLAFAGCLLPPPPAPPRFFTPIDPPPRERPAMTFAPIGVRVGPVQGPLHLREQMTWRRSEVELGFYDQRRWAELPSTYVQRALVRELVTVQHVPIGASSDVPVVTVELRAFEEVLAPVHEARVELGIEVVGPGCVLLRQGFAASRPLEGDDPTAVARGIGGALDEVVESAAMAIRRSLDERRRCGT